MRLAQEICLWLLVAVGILEMIFVLPKQRLREGEEPPSVEELAARQKEIWDSILRYCGRSGEKGSTP